MDGSTFLLDVATGNILQEGPKHRKYVVRACWAPDGSTFATASYDKTAAVWTRSTADDHVFAEREHLQMYSPVECLTMAPPAPGSSAAGSAESEAGGVELVLGQRDDCRLALHALADMSVSYINMNELGDDFVSFAPMDVATSPDATLFLVSTDKDRVLIVSREHKCLVIGWRKGGQGTTASACYNQGKGMGKGREGSACTRKRRCGERKGRK